MTTDEEKPFDPDKVVNSMGCGVFGCLFGVVIAIVIIYAIVSSVSHGYGH